MEGWGWVHWPFILVAAYISPSGKADVGNYHLLHGVGIFSNSVSLQETILIVSVFVNSPMTHKLLSLKIHAAQAKPWYVFVEF